MGRNDFDDAETGEWVDDALDDRLRSEFARSLGGDTRPDLVLRELAPEFGRARRRHQAKQAMFGVAASVLFLGGVGVALSSVENQPDDSTTVAGEPEIEFTDDESDPLEVDGTTTTQRPRDSTATTEVSTTTNATPTTTGTTIVSPTSVTPPTTAPVQVATTIDGSPSTTLIESECGSLGVLVSGSAVTLVEIFPAAGYRADEKSSGPEEIEVSFEGGGEHCELKAEMREGRLVIEDD